MKLGRRRVVTGLGAMALARCGPRGRPGVFPLGVASGDVTSTSALVWTRYAGEGPLQLRIWRVDDADAARVQDVMPGASTTVLATCDALEPGRWYRFRFEAPDATSAEGRFRTALADDALEPIVIGSTSCIRAGVPYDVLGRAAGLDLDAFVFLGDAVYTDGSSTLADFSQKWADGLAGPEYQALRASTSMVAVWDDHEVKNNWEGGSVDPTLFTNAFAAFRDHQPLRLDPAHPNRTWRSLRWGRTAELFALDSRAERSRADGHYLSPTQLDWLIDRVRASPATFKVVLNAVPIGEFNFPFYAPFNDDHWLSYPDQRIKLLEALDAVPGTLVLSGDFHFGSFGRAAKTGPGSKVHEVLVGPGANAPNPSPSYPSQDPWEFSTAWRNIVTLGLEPVSRVATIRFHGTRGIFFERSLAL